METQKIVNLLNGSDNENSKFATKKWYVIDSESKGVYSHEDEIKFLTSSLESSLWLFWCIYFGHWKYYYYRWWHKYKMQSCTPFKECRTEINETFVDKTEHINIAMPMYNLIEYSDNYSDTSGSLWQLKRDEIEEDVDLTFDDNHIQIISHHSRTNQALLQTEMG